MKPSGSGLQERKSSETPRSEGDVHFRLRDHHHPWRSHSGSPNGEPKRGNGGLEEIPVVRTGIGVAS